MDTTNLIKQLCRDAMLMMAAVGIFVLLQQKGYIEPLYRVELTASLYQDSLKVEDVQLSTSQIRKKTSK